MWLAEVISRTKNFEAPQSFYLWSAIAAMSAIVKDKVYIHLPSGHKVYPNVYVILYAPSGLKKSHPVNVARKIVEMLDCTRVIPGRFSAQALMQELGRNALDIETGVEHTDSCGFICSSEFAASVVKDTQAIPILTDLFDRQYNEGNRKTLLKSGGEILKSPTLTVLGAANDEMFRDVIAQRDLKGGFLGRIFLIDEYKQTKLNSLMFEDEHSSIKYNELIQPILNRKDLEGPFNFPLESRKFFHDWYMKYFSASPEDDGIGSQSRLWDKVLKIAMILSLCRDSEMIITEKDIEWSVKLCIPTIRSAAKVAGKGGEQINAMRTGLLLDYLAHSEGYKRTRKEVLSKYYGTMDAWELDNISRTLLEAGLIWERKEGSTTVYTLQPKARARFKED